MVSARRSKVLEEEEKTLFPTCVRAKGRIPLLVKLVTERDRDNSVRCLHTQLTTLLSRLTWLTVGLITCSVLDQRCHRPPSYSALYRLHFVALLVGFGANCCLAFPPLHPCTDVKHPWFVYILGRPVSQSSPALSLSLSLSASHLVSSTQPQGA